MDRLLRAEELEMKTNINKNTFPISLQEMRIRSRQIDYQCFAQNLWWDKYVYHFVFSYPNS